MLDSEHAMTTFLNYIATEPEIARVPVMIDSSRWSRHRSRPQVRPGQEHRQLDQPQGRRRGFSAQGEDRPALRRGRRRHGLRRDRSGRHDPAEGRDLSARLQAADGTGRIRSVRHHLRSEHPGDCDRPRGAQRLRGQLPRGDADHQGDLPGREGERRRQQSLVLVPRQRPGARSDSLGLPLPCHQGGHGHGHRERRPAGRLRGHSEGAPRARRGHHLQPPARRDRAHGAVRRNGEGRREEARSGRCVAAGDGRSAVVPRARARGRGLHRAGCRRSEAEVRPPAADHRRPPHGWDEDRR